MTNLLTAKKLGQRLSEERERLGMSQEEFGAAGGVSRVSQYLYERGERGPTVEYLGRIAAAGADVGFLMAGIRGKDDKGRICLDTSLLDSIYRLVDQYGRDEKGRSLDIEYRLALFRSLCNAVVGLDPDDVDWLDLQAIAEKIR